MYLQVTLQSAAHGWHEEIMEKDNIINVKDFTKHELEHALEIIKTKSPEQNGRLLEILGYAIAEELWVISKK